MVPVSSGLFFQPPEPLQSMVRDRRTLLQHGRIKRIYLLHAGSCFNFQIFFYNADLSYMLYSVLTGVLYYFALPCSIMFSFYFNGFPFKTSEHIFLAALSYFCPGCTFVGHLSDYEYKIFSAGRSCLLFHRSLL